MINLRHLTRYAVTGGISFVVEYGSFLPFYYAFHLQENIAHSISFVLSAIVNFSLLRLWVFAASRDNRQLPRQTASYLLLISINFVISNLIISAATKLGAPAYAAKLITICLIVIWNYAFYKKIIFKKPQQN